jgi:uncharacterized protein YdaU (DUF1376 family)
MSRWYKRDPIAFLDGVHGLGADTIGAYAVILELMYARGGPIQNDPRWIGSVLGCPTKTAQALIRRLLEAGKLFLDGDKLSNEKVLTTIRESAERTLTAQKNGALGGAQRALKASETKENNDITQAVACPRIERREEREKEIPNGISKKTRGTRLPDDWKPDDDKFPDELHDRICELIPQADRADWVNDQLAGFRDYWAAKTGAGATKLDWDKTLHNWMRKELNDVRRRNWARSDAQAARVIDFDQRRRR